MTHDRVMEAYKLIDREVDASLAAAIDRVVANVFRNDEEGLSLHGKTFRTMLEQAARLSVAPMRSERYIKLRERA